MQKEFNTKLLTQFLKFEELFSNFLTQPEPSVIKCVELLLKELSSFSFIDKIYVYLTNEETFLFDYLTEFPHDNEPNKPELTEAIGKEELINTSMSTLDIQVCKSPNGKSYNLLIPLFSFNKLLGFAVIHTNLSQDQITILFMKLLRVFFNQMATAIDLLNTNEHLNQTKDNYQQLLATKSLESQRANLEFSDRLKEITTNLSMILPHEIRTPINQILGSTKLLKEYTLFFPEEDSLGFKEIVDDIDTSVKRLRRLTENYIFFSNLVIISNDISRLQQLSKERVLSPQSIIFERCSLLMHHQQSSDNLMINLIDAPIKMNEVFLNKIVDELMDNAIKFSYPNSQIKINSFVEGQYYVLSILNQGKGLTNKEIENIQPFLQFDRTYNEQQGSGLGLSIVYKVMHMFGGKVVIQSVPNSNFQINLYFLLDS